MSILWIVDAGERRTVNEVTEEEPEARSGAHGEEGTERR
jgi:hypothetical protein